MKLKLLLSINFVFPTDASGWYAYFESSSLPNGARGGLDSPLLPGASASYCQMEFFYHMYGTEIGSLSIMLLTGSNSSQLLWQQEADRGKSWFPARVAINSSEPFRVRFVARRGTGWRSDIAVDDVRFGPCSNPISGEEVKHSHNATSYVSLEFILQSLFLPVTHHKGIYKL